MARKLFTAGLSLWMLGGLCWASVLALDVLAVERRPASPVTAEQWAEWYMRRTSEAAVKGLHDDATRMRSDTGTTQRGASGQGADDSDT